MLKKPIQIILDFDGTLTKKDTLHLVAEAGYSKQKIIGSRSQLPPWQDIVNAYLDDYNVHSSQYQPSSSYRKALLCEAAWLDSLQNVERTSAERVNDAGIFNGLTKEDIEVAAANALQNGEVQLRPGWVELLSTINRVNRQSLPTPLRHGDTQIFSVNWSRCFVWSVLWHAGTSLKDPDLRKKTLNALSKLSVYANEVPSLTVQDESAITSVPSPGGKAMALRTAGDKLKHMQSQARLFPHGSNVTQVYIGDSTTDLECLLMADVGICVRNQDMSSGQKELDATCQRLGVQIKSLRGFEERPGSVSTFEELDAIHALNPVTIYYVHDFHEVNEWLVRIIS